MNKAIFFLEHVKGNYERDVFRTAKVSGECMLTLLERTDYLFTWKRLPFLDSKDFLASLILRSMSAATMHLLNITGSASNEWLPEQSYGLLMTQ